MSRGNCPALPAAKRRVGRRHSDRESFKRVMRELAQVSGTRQCVDPFVEKLNQCPEAFTAGEMVARMFDVVKYRSEESPADDRLLPPAGVVFPLV